MARRRGRNPGNRWIGMRMEDPTPDIAGLAEAQGAVGIGPDRSAGAVKAAIAKGVAVLESGGVCVIDFHVDPPAARSDGIGHRPTVVDPLPRTRDKFTEKTSGIAVSIRSRQEHGNE